MQQKILWVFFSPSKNICQKLKGVFLINYNFTFIYIRINDYEYKHFNVLEKQLTPQQHRVSAERNSQRKGNANAAALNPAAQHPHQRQRLLPKGLLQLSLVRHDRMSLKDPVIEKERERQQLTPGASCCRSLCFYGKTIAAILPARNIVLMHIHNCVRI